MTKNEASNLERSYQEYLTAVKRLASAFGNLLDKWEIVEDLEQEYGADHGIDFTFDAYPFDYSFDEMCSGVYAFRDEVQDWYDNEVPNIISRNTRR